MRDETAPPCSAAPSSEARDPRPSIPVPPPAVAMIHRACQGDREAQESLLRDCAGPLARLASGLMPAHLRLLADSQDVVQDVLTRTARRFDRLACADDAALLAYLRRAVRHRVVDEIRRVRRLPPIGLLTEDWPTSAVSPLEAAITAQNARRMQAALGGLGSRERVALLLRLRRESSYEEIAARLDFPSPNAARVAVRRAAARLNEILEQRAIPGRAAGAAGARFKRRCRTAARA